MDLPSRGKFQWVRAPALAIWRATPAQTRTALLLLGLMLLSMAAFRTAFALVNREVYHLFGMDDLMGSFAVGLRFDLHTLMLLAGPFFLLLHLPGPLKRAAAVRRLLIWVPAFLFLAGMAVFLIDIHYYTDAGRHLSYEVFEVGANAGDLWSSVLMVVQYRGSILLYVLFAAGFLAAWRWLASRAWGTGEHRGPAADLAWLILFLVFMALGVRGTLEAKPLRITHAFSQGRVELGHLALNPLFTIGNTLRMGDARIPSFYPVEAAEAAVRDLLDQDGVRYLDGRYPLYRAFDRSRPAAGRLNVVVVVIEGWPAGVVGALGTRPSQMPVFDHLADDGLLFTNFLANGGRSVEGMTAICLGIPPYRDADVQAGSLGQNSFRGLAQILGDVGYASLFIHGGKVGTLGLNGYSRVTGFDSYVGMEDLDLEPGDYDGAWGVFDHAMAGYVNQELSRMKEPFVALWFTLSSHKPYRVPDGSFKVNPPEVEGADFLDSVRYADWSLGRFFDAVRAQDYFKRTVFVLVADHTAGFGLKSLYDRSHIPMLLYAPGLVPAGRVEDVAGQLDLLPTILDLVGAEGGHHAMGVSLIRERRPFSLVTFGGGYGWFSEGFMLTADGDGNPMGAYDYRTGERLPRDPVGALKDMRAYLQVTKTLIRDNRLAPLQ